jgi:hypothetical protein
MRARSPSLHRRPKNTLYRDRVIDDATDPDVAEEASSTAFHWASRQMDDFWSHLA